MNTHWAYHNSCAPHYKTNIEWYDRTVKNDKRLVYSEIHIMKKNGRIMEACYY